ncbi:MAG: Hpt domain-containing protein [Lentimicrobiaceae bacterium]|nr:Hpt domain-containing protein [Lentimicrobiaceae bacterium]MCB9024321.1 Hpt domain-containing protein [Lentimicrobiaceae bacterium]
MVNKQNFYDTYQYFDKSIIVEIIDIFINEYAERFEKLTKNIAEKDFQNMRFNAHSLKGVIANFSAPVPLEMVKVFEKNAAHLLETNGEDFDETAITKSLEEIKEATITMAHQLSEIKAEILNS